MTYSRPFNAVWQRLSFTANHPNDLSPHNSSAMRTVATVGAMLLVGASAALGSYYGYLVGSHQHVLVGIVFAGAALGGELLKPYAVDAAIEAASRFRFVRALACAALAAVCITYSLAAELSLAAGSRGDLAASRAAAVATAEGMAAERHRAETELSALPSSRPVQQLDAEIDGLLLTPGAKGCAKIDGPISREVCSKVAALRSERGMAVRRAELEATLKSAVQTSPQMHVHDADPLAGAVATYAKVVGWSFTAEDALPWLALVPVLFLELGSALALVVVRASGPLPTQAAPSALEDVPAIADAPVAVAEPATPAKRRERKAVKGPLVLGEMADRIRQAGGELQGSQRSIAESLGVSKSTVQRTLQVLIASGTILATVGPHGTRFALA